MDGTMHRTEIKYISLDLLKDPLCLLWGSQVNPVVNEMKTHTIRGLVCGKHEGRKAWHKNITLILLYQQLSVFNKF